MMTINDNQRYSDNLHVCLRNFYLVACAVRYFCVALLRRRLSSLERVPAPGAPTPFTTTP